MVLKENILLQNGETVQAICPVIVSASRATDIPAFFAKSFFQSLKQGYTVWINPFNNKSNYISFHRTHLIVFWSKNPAPLLPYLQELEKRNIHTYLHFTLNDYENEGFEPDLPALEDRISTFKTYVEQLGKGKVIWRFDPLLLSDKVDIDTLLGKIKRIGDELYTYTEKLIFSFADIDSYRKVKSTMRLHGINYQHFTTENMLLFAQKLQQLNKSWSYELETCAETIDLKNYGILPAKCIDDRLMLRFFSDDTYLMQHIGAEKNIWNQWEIKKKRKDKGQRADCNCIPSKDIGLYNSCKYACVYCYANRKRF